MKPYLCFTCEQLATHVCSGLDVPPVYFCEKHGKEHEAVATCGGQLVKMGFAPEVLPLSEVGE